MATKSFHGIELLCSDLQGVTSAVVAAAVEGLVLEVRLINAGTLHAAWSDPEYFAMLQAGGFNLPDGRPLAAVLKMTPPLGLAVRQIRGPDFFEAVLDLGRSSNLRHFLLGTTDATLGVLKAGIESRFPGCLIVGTYAPPFGDRSKSEVEAADAHVRSCNPHIVWVALGTPRQDFEAARIARGLHVTTAAVGAAFDFTAGIRPEAPRLLRFLGLEWGFRFMTEPARLWRRYVFGNMRFIVLATRHLLAGSRSKPVRDAS